MKCVTFGCGVGFGDGGGPSGIALYGEVSVDSG